MGLMFSRVANNFAKNGYYPTDERTMAGILAAVNTEAEHCVILDPCCGEGAALAELKHHLSVDGAAVAAYGIEYDHDRAWNAKSMLDQVAHADIHDMAIKVRQFGLLFLNPPYGDLVGDKAALSDASHGRKRLEKEFYKRAHHWLAFDGVLVLILPHYAFDAELANMIARQYRDVQVFMAPEQQFKQCVLFGIKRKSDRLDPAVVKKLIEMAGGQLPPELPSDGLNQPYNVPKTVDTPLFVANRLNVREMGFELSKSLSSTLWPQWASHMGNQVLSKRRPLRPMSQWHLALALAAGQVSGVVKATGGRVLLVKGDTYKDKKVVTTFEDTGKKDGSVREVRVSTDKFVPQIRAIDFTPGGMYGHLVTIQ